jgi:hypothetical protein
VYVLLEEAEEHRVSHDPTPVSTEHTLAVCPCVSGPTGGILTKTVRAITYQIFRA